MRLVHRVPRPRCCGLAALTAVLSGAEVSVAQGRATTIAIRAARVLDVTSGHIESPGTVLDPGDRIEAGVKPDSTIDLGDVTLLPGLIDAHVHLTLAGQPDSNARANLLAGFTTVQDLGAIGRGIIELRDAI